MITDSFKPGRSVLHCLDCRPKLILLLAITVAFFLPIPALYLIPYVVLLSLLTLLCLGFKELAKPILAILPILILVTLLTPPFHRGGEPILSLMGRIVLTTEGLRETERMIFRFTGITLAFFLYFRTTDINNLVLALRWFGLPFKSALVVTIAFRYIPYMMNVYSNVVDAHKLRSGKPGDRQRGWAFIRRIRRILPVLTSVIIYAIKSIPLLSMALESRGVGRKNPRTIYIELKQGASLVFDFAISLLVVCLLLSPAFIPL
jgi:energy-coupling factor transport system permease protein